MPRAAFLLLWLAARAMAGEVNFTNIWVDYQAYDVRDVAFADMNGDSTLEILAASAGENGGGLLLYWQAADSAQYTKEYLHQLVAAECLDVQDTDGDAIMDVWAAGSGPEALYLSGSPFYGPGEYIHVAYHVNATRRAEAIVAADLDNDGRAAARRTYRETKASGLALAN